jgi:4-diphosphocytidyl-2C-methyl-D-erythritol kinase
MHNDLQKAAIGSVPEIARILEFFEKSGSIYSAVSGSGSAVFAIFDDSELRDRAVRDAGEICERGCAVFSCETNG